MSSESDGSFAEEDSSDESSLSSLETIEHEQEPRIVVYPRTHYHLQDFVNDATQIESVFGLYHAHGIIRDYSNRVDVQCCLALIARREMMVPVPPEIYILKLTLIWEIDFCMSQEGDFDNHYERMTYLARRDGLHRDPEFVRRFSMMLEIRYGLASIASRGTGELLDHLRDHFPYSFRNEIDDYFGNIN